MAEFNEAHNQLKQQLAEETGHSEELRRQLQGKQRELDQVRLAITWDPAACGAFLLS